MRVFNLCKESKEYKESPFKPLVMRIYVFYFSLPFPCFPYFLARKRTKLPIIPHTLVCT